MSPKKIKLDVVTPDRIEFSKEVDMVVAPGVEGYIGILPGHIPMVVELATGVLKIFDEGEEILAAVSEGYMEVTGSKVVILAEAAELRDEIDVERALAAKRRAEERLAKKDEELNYARARASLQRALNRLKVAGGSEKERGRNNP